MKLLLIDRDGVINEEVSGYVKSPEEFVFTAHAFEAFAFLKRHGFMSIVITNQSVVGRGIISQARLDEIHGMMCKKIQENGGELAEIIVCTDAPENAGYRRKPSPGMLEEALKRCGADAKDTPFIGDALTDMQAAFAAGCPRYLVKTGKGRETMQNISDHLRPVTVCDDILDAVQKIVYKSLESGI